MLKRARLLRLPGCPFDIAWCLVCVVYRLTVDWLDCRCFLSFVFLGDARRLDLSPCNTRQRHVRPGVARSDSGGADGRTVAAHSLCTFPVPAPACIMQIHMAHLKWMELFEARGVHALRGCCWGCCPILMELVDAVDGGGGSSQSCDKRW